MEIRTIADVFDVGSSKRVFKSEWTKDGVPFYRAREVVKLAKDGFVNNELFISEEMFNQYSQKYGVPKPGDLLVTGVGTLGICYQVKEKDKFYFKDGNIVWLKNKGKVNSDYIEYCYKSPFVKRQIQSTADAAVVGTYTITNARETKIPLPPLEQQKQIASILDTADAYRQKTKALIEKYDALTQSLFLDMFGDPVTNPKGWKFIPISNLIVQKPDNGFFAKKDKYGENGTPVVWLTDFIDKIYISEQNLRRAVTQEKDNKYLLEYGDALFCRSSLNVEGIGKCSIAPSEFKEPTIFECHIIRVKLDTERVVPEYFRFLTKTAYFRKNVMKNAKTSTMTTISQEGISKINVPVPEFQLQLDFKGRLKAIEAQKILAQQELDKADELFNSLLQKAFKGELV